MLKAIGWLIKSAAFALVVLVAANYFKIGKRTVSDQIHTQLSHAESAAEMTGIPKAASSLKSWAHRVTADQKDGARIEMNTRRRSARLRKHHPVKIVSEEIPSSERQKLRALMRELNSSRASE